MCYIYFKSTYTCIYTHWKYFCYHILTREHHRILVLYAAFDISSYICADVCVLDFFFKCIYFWERACKCEQERGRERGERIPSRLRAVSTEPNVGLDPTNREIVTWAEFKSQTLKWLSQPGTPFLKTFDFILLFVLSRLHSERGARTHDPKIKSRMLYRLSQPDTLFSFCCLFFVFKKF